MDLGVGTIVSALIVGPIVNLINVRIPLIGAIRNLRAVEAAE